MASDEPDAIASFLWASPSQRPTERMETVLSPKAVSQLVGGLTEKLKDLEEVKGVEERRRQVLLSELSDTRTQLALTRSQLLRLEVLAALFVVARLLTSSSLVSSHVTSTEKYMLEEKQEDHQLRNNHDDSSFTSSTSASSFCIDVMAWIMVWLGGCSLIEGLVGVALVSQLVYLLLLDDVDPFVTSDHNHDNDDDEFDDKNIGNGTIHQKNNSEKNKNKKGDDQQEDYQDDLNRFLPEDCEHALSAMHDSSALWTQPATFRDSSTGLAVWHRPIGAAVHEFKFTVDINSEPAPVFAVAREVELMPTWNPFISTGLTLHYSPPPDCSIRAYLQIQLPWPLPKFAVVVKGKLFDCLESKDKCLVVALGSEREKGSPPEGLKPPSTPQEIRRLWVRVIAKAKPVRTCPKNTPLHVTAGGSLDENADSNSGGWFVGGSGSNADSAKKPKTHFEVIAKIKFPIPSPGWVIRFIISTLAPLIVTKVQQLLPSLMQQLEEGENNEDEEMKNFPDLMSKDRALYGSVLTDKVRRAVPPPPSTGSNKSKKTR